MLEYIEGWFIASVLKLDHVNTIFTFMTKENILEEHQDVPLEVDMGNYMSWLSQDRLHYTASSVKSTWTQKDG